MVRPTHHRAALIETFGMSDHSVFFRRLHPLRAPPLLRNRTNSKPSVSLIDGLQA
jgi:hypothetical protein